MPTFGDIVKAHMDAHEELVIAIEDFCNSCISEGARKRLVEALKKSRELLNKGES